MEGLKTAAKADCSVKNNNDGDDDGEYDKLTKRLVFETSKHPTVSLCMVFLIIDVSITSVSFVGDRIVSKQQLNWPLNAYLN